MAGKQPRFADFLDHIVEALRRIAGYIAGLDFARFSESQLVKDAVIRNPEILGEAVKHIERDAPGFIEAYPRIPWSFVVAMRNRVAHGYFAIDDSIVWKTITSDLPPLSAAIAEVRAALPPGPD